MPLSLPNLDDRRYADLVEEARSLIPSYAPEWTNHNPSDPGITLVEMFAYLTEMLVYRVNRVTDANVRAFVKLLAGKKADPNRPLNEEVRNAVLGLRQTVRAVTAADYELLAVSVPNAGVARARCLPLRNLEAPNPFAQEPEEREGHVSVVVVPAQANPSPDSMSSTLVAVRKDLEPRKLLTTRLHVVGPRYVTLRLKTIPATDNSPALKTTLMLKPGEKERWVKGDPPEQKGVVDLAADALTEFFHPLRGGPDGRGWPFGRSIYVSEIYALLDGVPGVEYVSKLLLEVSVRPRGGSTRGEKVYEISVPPRAGAPAVSDADAARMKTKGGEAYAFTLEPDELVDARISADDIAAERPKYAPKFVLTQEG